MDLKELEANKLDSWFGFRANPDCETKDEWDKEKTEAEEKHLKNPEDEQYLPCEEATRPEECALGEIKQFNHWDKSTVFPGTHRDWSLYTPPDFDHWKQMKTKEVQTFNVVIFNDGPDYLDDNGKIKAAAVFDTLLHQKKIRPVIAIFMTAGSPSKDTPLELPKKRGPIPLAMCVPKDERKACLNGHNVKFLQRSLEYDTLSGRLADFYIKDIIPVVEQEIGLEIMKDGKLNKEIFPKGIVVCGRDSGALAAFTMAYHQPFIFTKVMSHCGSYTGNRGGQEVPYIVRTTDAREVRVFMTSGENDLISPHGDWHLANKTMFAALKYARYDVECQIGKGGHTLNYGGSLFAKGLLYLYGDFEFKDDEKGDEEEEEEDEEDDEEEDDD